MTALQTWLDTTLREVIKDVASTPEGNRNARLHWGARRLGEIAHGGLDEKDCKEALEQAAQDNRLWEDDGDKQCRASIKSGWDKGISEPEDLSGIGTKTNGKAHTNGQASEFDRRIVGRRMSTVKTRVPTWVWEYDGKGRIQHGTLTLFAGKPAAGKSTAARWFASRLTRGELDGCWHGTPMDVAVLTMEEQTDCIVAPGLNAAGADMHKVHEPEVLQGSTESSIMAIQDEQRLTQWLLDNDIRALFVDPIMSTFGGKVDVNRTNEVREYLEPYSRIAKAINGIAVGIVHLKKGEIRDVLASINGSSAFGEVPRAVFGFAPIDDGDHILQQCKNSAGLNGLKLTYRLPLQGVETDDGPTELPRFEITGTTELSITDVADNGDGEDASTLGAAGQWLEMYLYENQPAPSNQVKADAKEAGISERTLQRARKKLGVQVITASLPDKPRTTAWILARPETELGSETRHILRCLRAAVHDSPDLLFTVDRIIVEMTDDRDDDDDWTDDDVRKAQEHLSILSGLGYAVAACYDDGELYWQLTPKGLRE